MGIFDGLTQVGRPVKATTPVGEDTLFPTRVTGVEGLSRPFQFTVDFAAPFAEVKAPQMLGKPVTLTVDAPGGQDRFVHGLVSRWSELGHVGVGELGVRTYRAELVPWLWMLTLSSDCRTFENMTVQEIVEAVFKARNFTDFRWRMLGATPKVAYAAQYQESDFAFVSRLLEEYGLYYAFEYEASRHRMVISNSVGTMIPAGAKNTLAFQPFVRPLGTGQPVPGLGGVPGLPGVPNIPGSPPGTPIGEAGGKALGGVVGSLLGPLGTAAGSALGSVLGGLVDGLLADWFGGVTGPPEDTVTELVRERVVHTATVAAQDFHLLRSADRANEVSKDPGANGERFGFLGDLSGTEQAGVAKETAKRLIEAVEAGRDVVRGASTAPHLTPGTSVKFTGGVAPSGGVEVHVTAVAHVLETGSLIGADRGKLKYFNEFAGVPVATPFLPERATPRPSVRGTQTAEVVGVGGPGEIDVDKDGRVLLRFPWDRGAGKDGKSQHRVHLATTWAGAGWGAVHIPRVGQLVLVEFLEGDPDRPIVTGRVYSNNHAHPYALPANKTQSGVKSRTLGGGAENFNELRFEDKKGAEHVFLQAEKDLTENVKNDRKATIGHHDHHVVTHDKEGDQFFKVVKGTQSMLILEGTQIIQNKKGDQALSALDGRQLMRIEKGPQEFKVDDGDRSVNVLKGNNTRTISGTDATDADTITLTAKTKIELKVQGSTITMTPAEIKIVQGGSKITVGPSGVKIEGPMVEAAAQAQAKLKGAMVACEGQAMTEVKGALTQVTGSGMLKLGGGVVMAG